MLTTELKLQSPPACQAADQRRYQRLLRLGPGFDLLDARAERRPHVENYISKQFREAYGAEVGDFLPLLLTMECQGSLSAAVGITPGASGPFFLEQYLGMPIERALSRDDDRVAARHSIAEIGNLVATGNGVSLSLFIVLVSALAQAEFEILVFTATESLRKKFDRLGLMTEAMAPACESALGRAGSSSWGSYYAQSPEVMAASVRQAVDLIAGNRLYALMRLAFQPQIQALANNLAAARMTA